MKVLAAMSGGVDSAVAAARAVEAGHDVTGVHLALSKNPQTYRSGARGAAPSKTHTMLAGPRMCSAFPSTYGISQTGSPLMW